MSESTLPAPVTDPKTDIPVVMGALGTTPRLTLLLALSATQLRAQESIDTLFDALTLSRVNVSERTPARPPDLSRNSHTVDRRHLPSSYIDTGKLTRHLALLAPLRAWFSVGPYGPPEIPGGESFLKEALHLLRTSPETVELGWKLLRLGQNHWQAAASYRRLDYSTITPPALRAGAALLLLGGIDPERIGLAASGPPTSLVLTELQQGLLQVLPAGLDTEDILRLPIAVQSLALLRQIRRQLWRPSPSLPRILALARERVSWPPLAGGLDQHQRLWARQLELDVWLARPTIPAPPPAGEMSPLLEDVYRATTALFDASPADPAKVIPTITRDFAKRLDLRDVDLPGLCGTLQVLALAADSGAKSLTLLGKLAKTPSNVSSVAPIARGWVEAVQAGRTPELPSSPRATVNSLQELYVLALLHYWAGLPLSKPYESDIRALLPVLDTLGWQWLADGFRIALGADLPAGPPVTWRNPQRAWERTLTALTRFAGMDARGGETRHPRLRIELEIIDGGSPSRHQSGPLVITAVQLTVRERSPTAQGYTTGRVVPPNKAADTATRLGPEELDARAFLRLWEQSGNPYVAASTSSKLVAALVGLVDTVELSRPGSGTLLPVDVRSRKPALSMEPKADGSIRVQLNPPPQIQGSHFELDLREATLTLVQYDAETLALAQALSEDAALPAAALPQLAALTPSLERKLPLANRAGQAARRVAPLDRRLHVQVEPMATGLRFQLRVRPLGPGGVFCLPGQGSAESFGVLEGETVLVQRDLAGEQRALEQLYAQLPLLAGAGVPEPLELSDPEAALELLEQLQGLGTDEASRVPLHWPAKPVSISSVRSASGLRLKLGGQRDWLAAEGQLTLDDGEVVSLARLLDALPSSHSRFVQLGEGKVLALSQRLARQLRQLKLLREAEGSVKLPWLAAATLEPLLAEAGAVDSSGGFRERIGRIREAMALDPALPPGFGADLRDYQCDGVRWLLRLAHWAPGACLADDMGLGKTVQALAVLQSRAALGPQLVVAPTSVVGNWRREASRFTPSLDVRVYAEGDRSATLASLGPGSLLLLSYGLLAQDIEALKAVAFRTVVHDEAQAIKNPQTLRAQAARQLQADFSIATTGTPIENHLGELWSLFRLIAPGLLGSQEQFSRRFATPIASDSTSTARSTLRALIAPFILRRNKHEVLDELPSRTEVILRVEADAEEARLQQALRRQALERLQAEDEDDNRRRFNILAALMRLRRAACHPNLVAPELGLPGSKLGQLLELIEELREGHHRALVFSQFTDFLALVRKALDARGLRYQYLDGQTAPKARQQAVDAFQAGDGDLFLLSLKAGGVGLNLTAADYVIHLDPWWNPAIEQQATDRAHRIGQTRPVTVYKLVLAGSIEEQILSLHGSKRELVDAMLAEQDGGSRLGLDDLLGLLRGVGD